MKIVRLMLYSYFRQSCMNSTQCVLPARVLLHRQTAREIFLGLPQQQKPPFQLLQKQHGGHVRHVHQGGND